MVKMPYSIRPAEYHKMVKMPYSISLCDYHKMVQMQEIVQQKCRPECIS